VFEVDWAEGIFFIRLSARAYGTGSVPPCLPCLPAGRRQAGFKTGVFKKVKQFTFLGIPFDSPSHPKTN